jgi:hypothetical protein
MKVTIETINQTETFGSGFQKREFIGVDNSNPDYPQPIKFEAVKDNCQKLDNFNQGQEVDVEFNIRGNRWTNKEGKEIIFNSLQVWKITGEASSYQADKEHSAMTGDEPDSLPF